MERKDVSHYPTKEGKDGCVCVGGGGCKGQEKKKARERQREIGRKLMCFLKKKKKLRTITPGPPFAQNTAIIIFK